MVTTSTLELTVSFDHAIASFDENTKSLASALAEFVDARDHGNAQRQIDAWHRYIRALDERLDSRVRHLVGSLMSGKEISDRLREYNYIASDHLE